MYCTFIFHASGVKGHYVPCIYNSATETQPVNLCECGSTVQCPNLRSALQPSYFSSALGGRLDGSGRLSAYLGIREDVIGTAKANNP